MEEIKSNFIGTWHLQSWQYYINNKEIEFWKNPQGILIYTKEGKMSAILMKPNRTLFESPFLSKGSESEKIEAINGYISYAGDFSIDNDFVYHHVMFSLFPNWIGTDLKRLYNFNSNNQELKLSTSPELAPNGKEIKNILIWKKA